MIALDTNVLLRHVLNDDSIQAARARAVFAHAKQILITDIALVEMAWTLKGKRYNASRDDIAMIVMTLFAEPKVIFESPQAVWAALNDYIDAPQVRTANGWHAADLADALLINKAKMVALQRDELYEATYTFDTAALTLDGTAAP